MFIHSPVGHYWNLVTSRRRILDQVLTSHRIKSESCCSSQSPFSFIFFTDCVTFVSRMLICTGVYSPFCLCSVSCATGCHTTPKHNRSTPMLKVFLSSNAAPFFSKHTCVDFGQSVLFFYFFLLHHPIALVVKMLLCIHKMFTFMMRSQVMFLSDDSSMQIRCKQCCRIEYSTTTGIQYSTLSANSSSRPFLPFGDFALPFCPA